MVGDAGRGRPRALVEPDSDSEARRVWRDLKPELLIGLPLSIVCALFIAGLSVLGGSPTEQPQNSATEAIESAQSRLSETYHEQYSYREIREATDAAITAAGQSVNHDSRAQAWETVFELVEHSELTPPSPMVIMECVDDHAPTAEGSGIEKFEAAANFCAERLAD